MCCFPLPELTRVTRLRQPNTLAACDDVIFMKFQFYSLARMTNKWLPFFFEEMALARVSVCSIRIFSAPKHSFVIHVKICLIKNANRREGEERSCFWHVLDFVGFRLMNWWMCKGKVGPFGRSMLCDACERKFFVFFALRNRLSLPMSKFWRSHRPWSNTNGIKEIILVK